MSTNYSKYFSFLLCCREDCVEIYLSGNPVGAIRNGQFKAHQIVTPTGNLRDITMKDFQNLVAGSPPFVTEEELKKYLLDVVEKMGIKET